MTSGPVTNPGHELLFTHHQRSLLHHIDFHSTQTVTYHPKTTFPIIHCTDDTQLISLITHHTRFISLGLPLCDRWVLYAHIATLADSYLTEPFVVVIVLPCPALPCPALPLFPGLTLCLAVRTSFGLLLVYLDYLSALPCWILFVDPHLP